MGTQKDEYSKNQFVCSCHLIGDPSLGEEDASVLLGRRVDKTGAPCDFSASTSAGVLFRPRSPREQWLGRDQEKRGESVNSHTPIPSDLPQAVTREH